MRHKKKPSELNRKAFTRNFEEKCNLEPAKHRQTIGEGWAKIEIIYARKNKILPINFGKGNKKPPRLLRVIVAEKERQQLGLTLTNESCGKDNLKNQISSISFLIKVSGLL